MTAALLLAVSTAVHAQKPVNLGAEASATFTIAAIDHTARVVTLEGKDGLTQDVYCGPEVKRFDALKVGDKVTFRYYESLVSAISHPGAAPKPPAADAVTRATGARPGATISQQQTATVTIEAIDANVPSVTIRNAAGHKMSFKVSDPKNLQGYKVGDKVDITYTQALAITVTDAK